MRTSVLLKNDVSPANYVNYYMSKRNRSLFAQFRLGILPLHIEMGRYNNTTLEDKLCVLCNLKEVENEYHFLMSCCHYDEFSVTLFTKNYIKLFALD